MTPGTVITLAVLALLIVASAVGLLRSRRKGCCAGCQKCGGQCQETPKQGCNGSNHTVDRPEK